MMSEQKSWRDKVASVKLSAAQKLVLSSANAQQQAGKLSGLMGVARGKAGELSDRVAANLEQGRVTAVERAARARESIAQKPGPWKLLMPTTAPLATLPDLTAISEEQRLAYYGALLAMASADGHLDRDELTLLLDAVEADQLSGDALSQLKGYLVQPPALVDCLTLLCDGDETLRFGLLFQLVEMALADDVIQPEERDALQEACHTLGAKADQLVAIERFVLEARRLEARGKNDRIATECLKQAAGGLGSVGVPITAVYFSGSVVGLSASGITSGLAALGLGFGMVPGIAIAVVLGTGTFFGLGRLLDTGGARRRSLQQAESERRAQLVIRHLQEALAEVLARLTKLQANADTTEHNQRSILLLRDRMKTLQTLIIRKQHVIDEPC